MTLLRTAMVLGLAPVLLAQPRFEVATVKLAAPNAPRNRVMPSAPDRLSIPGMTLRWAIYTAYQEGMGTSWSVRGGPEWLDQTAYAIEAKAAQPSTQKELRVMLRTLLAERFGLKVRLEDQVGAPGTGGIYVLMRDGERPLGPNIKPWDGTCYGQPPPNQEDDPFVPRCASGYRGDGFFLEGGTMFSAAELLSLPQSRALLGTIVQDRTGLAGRYSLRLLFPFSAGRPAAGAAARTIDPAEIPGPTLFDAVREQWGLKLERGEGTLHLVIVESAERPTEN